MGKEEDKTPYVRHVPKTSQAPDPPITLRGGGCPPPPSRPPDYDHWNRFPILTLRECICLLIEIEPVYGTRFINPPEVRRRAEKLFKLAHAHQIAGNLSADNMLATIEFIRWAKSQGENVPTKWKPINNETLTSERLDEGLRAAKSILKSKHSAGLLSEARNVHGAIKLADIIDYIRKNPKSYAYCAATNNFPRRSKLKEREPTLSKAFIGILDDLSVVAYFDKLRNADR